jgi:hypothetical protein
MTGDEMTLVDRMASAVGEWQTRNLGNPAMVLVAPRVEEGFAQDWLRRAGMPGTEMSDQMPRIRPLRPRCSILGIEIASEPAIGEGILVFVDYQMRVMGAIKL